LLPKESLEKHCFCTKHNWFHWKIW